MKEKGNKINHFDEEVIYLILFDELNININMDEESNEKGKNDSQQEKKIFQKEKKINQVKTSFNSEEIIDMLKNPFKYHKKDINFDKIYSSIYEKMKEFKIKIGYMENNIGFDDLKSTCVKILEDIQTLVSSYEDYFNENKIDYQKNNKDEIIIDNFVEECLNNYTHIKELQKKINEKIKLYDEYNIKTLSELKNIADNCMKKVDKLIEEIKLNKQIKENNIISISDIFEEFKNTLKVRIVNDQEYGKYDKIFNDKNINEFYLEEVYSILKETLNYNNALFSIIKKDVTNYNLLVEVITEFNELKNFVYNQDLDILV